MISEQEVLNFAAASLRSVWALETLLLLQRQPKRNWRADELLRELRSSQVVVADALDNLCNAGLVVEEEGPVYRYQPGSPGMDDFVTELGKVYAAKPMAVIRAVVTSPNKKLQILSDAFRIKE
ncbi:MAG TPA: hypothetical protein VFA53_02760 [Xanthobacteraceae bacterium]|nr:hypothetical protein [Xanthobacteraceae bacterium]